MVRPVRWHFVFASAMVMATDAIAAQYVATSLGPELVQTWEIQQRIEPVDGLRIGPLGEVAAVVNGQLLIHRDGQLQRIAAAGYTLNAVKDINVAGDVLLSGGNAQSGALVYRDGTFVPYGLGAGLPARINDHGVAVGVSSGQVMLLGPGIETSVSAMPVGSFPTAINNAGTVAAQGPFDSARFIAPPLIVQGGTLHEPTAVGTTFGFIHDLNEANVGVGMFGTVSTSPRRLPATFDSQTITPLPIPGGNYGDGAAYAINERGDIVGGTWGGFYGALAVLWQAGSAIDLESVTVGLPAGGALLRAMDINDAGQIVALGCYSCNAYPYPHDYVAYLLTPVPEPATLSTLGTGATLIAVWGALGRRRSIRENRSRPRS